MTELTFLGTGDYFAGERYWNSFVIADTVLVEPSPIALPHLRRCGLDARDLDVIVISHFHADHTFGWPFLLGELLRRGREHPLVVAGPPRVDAFLADMVHLAGVPGIQRAAHERLDIRYVEVDGSWQTAGPLRFKAVDVKHVDHLECFGYLFDLPELMLGYSGDTRPCPGLDVLAEASDALVLECNGPHAPPVVHMTVSDVADLRRRFPEVRFVLTHLGAGVDASHIERCLVPLDFDRIDVSR